MATGKKINLQLGIGMTLLITILVACLLQFFLNGICLEIDLDNRLRPANGRFLLGTDDLGRDLLSCLVFGVAISLITGVTVVLIAVILGWTAGLVAGLAGGLIDFTIMRLVDLLLAFPGVLLAMSLVAIVGGGVIELIIILSCTSWVTFARMIRGEVLKYKDIIFVLAARSYNCSFSRLVIHHLVPVTFPLILTQASLSISGVILTESTLNFLGIGFAPLVPSLGQIISRGKDHIFDRPDLILLPGLVLLVLVVSFIFIAEGFSKYFSR